MISNGQPLPHKYTPIIDKATFEKCQDVLQGRHNRKSDHGLKEFALRGLITSPYNGKVISSFEKTKTYRNGESGSWTCLQYWDKNNKLKYVREDKILEQLESALFAIRPPEDITEAVLEYLMHTKQSERASFLNE